MFISIMDLEKSQQDDIISTLATENGWLSDDKCPLYLYQGFWYYGSFLRGAIAAKTQTISFDPSPSHIIIASNPKSGTTWLKALAFAIRARARFSEPNNHPLHLKNPHDLMPWLEMDDVIAGGDLNLVSTHLPYTALPASIAARRCKIVYIWRDPKAAFISRWLYSHKMRPNKQAHPIPLEDAFELFCNGVSSFGPYWEHVLGYWKALQDRPESVMLLKYEDMMDNTELHVKRLAEFMGCPFSPEEEEGGMLARIVEMCSFERLSNLEVNKSGLLIRPMGGMSFSKDVFFRKAKVGDWSNYLTHEMIAKIDDITMDKLGPLLN